MSLGSLISGFIPQLIIGNFQFKMNVAVFQEMRRSTSYTWASQERMGQNAALQFTGEGEDTITLPGVIYPQYKGSASAMADLRQLAAQGQPQILIDGLGRIYGRWVITQVEETGSTIAAFGMPRKVEFNVTIKKFDGTDSSLLVGLLKSLIKSAIS